MKVQVVVPSQTVQLFGWCHTPDGRRWGGRYVLQLPPHTAKVVEGPNGEPRVEDDDWENQPGSILQWFVPRLGRAAATLQRTAQRKVEATGEAFDVATMDWVIEVVPEGTEPDPRVPSERAA